MKDSTAGLVTLGAVQGISIFTALMPDRSTLLKQDPSGEALRDLRNGQMNAGVLTIGLSALVAFMVKDPLPLYIGLGTTVAMCATYEMMLRQEKA